MTSRTNKRNFCLYGIHVHTSTRWLAVGFMTLIGVRLVKYIIDIVKCACNAEYFTLKSDDLYEITKYSVIILINAVLL
jgi:hypothetical protein